MKTTPKRLLGLLLAVLLIMAQPMAVLADNSGTSELNSSEWNTSGGVKWKIDSDGIMTIAVADNGNGESEISYTDKKQPWYNEMSKIKKLVVEEGVTRLGYNLMRRCTTLEEVVLPASLKFIDGNAFRGCTSLKKVTFHSDCEITTPDNKKEEFSFALFEGCTALEEIVLPAGDYTKLYSIAFGDCTSLKKITIPKNVTSMHNRDSKKDSPFLNCAALEQINYGGTVAQWEAIVADNLNYDGSLANSNITVICSNGTYRYNADGSGEEAEEVSGQTGNVNWTLDKNGKLTLSAKENSDGKTADFTKDNYNKKDDDGNYINALYGVKDKIKTIVVEEGVTYLGDYLLRGTAATSVSFPKSLTTIGNSCFRDSSLESVTIPENVTEIDNWAFMGCASLKTAVVNANITQLKERVFGNCAALTTVTLPATITSFEISSKNQNAFTACAALTTVNFGGTVDTWADLITKYNMSPLQKEKIFVTCSDGFYKYGTGKLTEITGTSKTTDWVLNLETGVLTVTAQPGTDGVGDDYATADVTPFYPFKSYIKSIVVEEGVTVLGYRMFRELEMESVSLPSTLVEIKSDCFRQCPNLVEITLPSSLKTLARTSFFKCTALTKVVLNGSYTVIEDKIFSGCKALSEIVWNAPIASINNQAFNACASVSSITFNGTISQWITMINTKGIMGGEPGKESTEPADGASSLRKEYITVHCTNGDYIYGRNYIENDLFYSLTDGVLVIDGNGAIADYEAGKAPWSGSASTITKVIIMSGITSVGENAFAGCSNIATVCYGGSEEQWAALKLASKAGNDTLFRAEYAHAYEGSIGDNVKWSFDPETGTMTYSGTGAMYDYTSRKGLPYFHLLGEVKSVVVEEGVTTIGNYAFQYMTELSSVSLPKSLRSVGTFAFGYCAKLTEVTIPEGVTHIGSKTFSSCKLTTLNLPSTLQYIDMKCFDGTSVVDVYYNGTKAAWEQIEISSQSQGNATLLSSNIHYQEDLTISDIVSDVTASDWYADHILYLYNNGLLNIENETVSPAETNNLNWLLNALYIRAGQSGQYEGAADWAISNGIIENDDVNTLSLSDLALILYRTAVYNGQAPAGGDKAALGWLNTQNYNKDLSANVTDLDNTRALTRGELASVLASYLGSEAGTADRDDVILAELKAIIENGGDNKMHIVSLDAPSGASKAGDSTLIIFPNGEVMLLDAMQNDADGVNSARLISILKRAGIKNIDYLVNSHAHSDHIGNFASIINYIYGNGGTVKHYYAAYGSNYCPAVQSTLENLLKTKGIDTNTGLREGDKLTIGGVTINIYAPTQAFLDETTGTGDEAVNNTSMVMKFTYGKSTYLTCGDIYRARERYLVSTYGDAIKADVIKLNHHGAYTSNSMDWIHATDAKIMFAPSDDVGDSILMGAVSAEGRAYYSNGCDGLIHISMDNEANYEVETRYDSNNRSTFVSPKNDVPADDDNKDNEKTGDNTPVMLMTAIAVLSLCASAWILVLNKKQRMF